MKLVIPSMLIVLVWMLLASCGSTVLLSKPRLTAPGAVLTEECNRPVHLPDTLNQGEVVTHWLTDRAELIACGDRLKALTDWYKQRDTALGG